MNIPYKTKTGLQIGLLYKPRPYIELDRDMLLIQEALLNNDKYLYIKKLKPLLYIFIFVFGIFGYFLFK